MLGCRVSSGRLLRPLYHFCRFSVPKAYYSEKLESHYTDDQKHKIIQVMNEESSLLSRYDISKAKLQKIVQWKKNNGLVKKLSDLEMVEGFTEKIAHKLFDSILSGKIKDVGNQSIYNKIKGQILHPNLPESVIKECRSVLTVYISVNSVCWLLIDKSNYEVLEWKYYGIDYPEGKKFQITDIMDISWRIIYQLPAADIYVMKAEATTLRAAGSDPNNPKVLSVNLQKAQMVAMIVALINASGNLSGSASTEGQDVTELKHKVYFLRPTLPYRLYGTLVGNEKVATDQTVEMLLRDMEKSQKDHVKVSEELKNMFRTQNDLEKDMLGHCFLLGLTFMDLCIYRNQERVAKLIKHGPS